MTIKQGDAILASQFVTDLVAGENITANDACYIKASDGKAYRCDADALSTIGFFGFAQETVTTGNSVGLRHTGQMDGFSGLTVGAKYFLSGTTGAITATAPTNFKFVGIAISSTVLQITKELTKRVRVYQVADSPATWTKPAGLQYVIVKVQGGGGGGKTPSAGNNQCASGGGGGGYSERKIEEADLGATETVTIGSGGAVDNSGNASSFGTLAVGNGGTVGNDGNAVGGAGGTATTGDVNIAGQDGGISFGNGAASLAHGGDGGDSVLGKGGFGAVISGGTLNGSAGIKYGGGGGGGARNSSGTLSNPTAGADGVVIVEEFY